MVAAIGRESSKNEPGTKPEGARPKARGTDSAKVSPLWQSLAMRPVALQRKLTISKADDPYEREADRVADQVMRMPAPQSEDHGLPITPVTSLQAQRKCAECEEEEEEEGVLRRKKSGAKAPATTPPIVHQTLSSPGRPLDAATRAYFEPRFGHDFSGVRIHTGGDAVSATHAVSAHAFTLGDQIAFAAGQYAPHTENGRRLLAHELTHTLQQARNPGLGIQRDAAAGGCAVDGADPVETGRAVHRQIQRDIRRSVDSRVRAEGPVPRAMKFDDVGRRAYVGYACPPRNRSYGLVDLYYFERPNFYLAEIKPYTDHVQGMEEYEHYGLRLYELKSRMLNGPLCPGAQDDENDVYFDRYYLSGYLLDSSGEDFYTNEFKPIELDAFEAQYAGVFRLRPTLHLFYWSYGDGTVLYECWGEDEKEDDLQDMRRQNAVAPADENRSVGLRTGFLTTAELVEPLERERPAITAELRRLGPRAAGDEYVLVATQGFFERLVLEPMAERQSQFMEVTPPGQRDPGLGMLNAAALLAGAGSALHGLSAGVLIIGDVLLLTPAAVALPPAKAGGELVILRAVTTAPQVQVAAQAAGVLLVATVFAPDSASAAAPQIMSVETLQALPVASLDGGERPSLFDQVTVNGATRYVAGFAKAGE